MKGKVIIAAYHHFTSTFQVGTHHYARAFEKLGYEVLYLSAPISPLHKLSSYDYAERKRIHKLGGVKEGNIVYYVPYALLTPYKRFPLNIKRVLDSWYKLTIPNICRYLEQAGFLEVDILWIDNPIFGFLMDKVKYGKSILRIADYSKGFVSWFENLSTKELEILKNVDLVVCTFKKLVEMYALEGKKVLYVPNGVDYTLFKNADKSFPREFESIPKPRVIYVGALREWFDTELLYHCAVNMPDCSFVLIGSEQIDLSNLKKLRNVFILGARPFREIPKYLYNSDVGIIPFDVNRHSKLINAVNPIKLYEYMACGLPVVSVSWEELRNIKAPVYLAKDKKEFCNLIRKAILDGRKNRNLYIKFAKRNDWVERLKFILQKLNEF